MHPSINVTAAALLTQFFLVIIGSLAAAMMRENPYAAPVQGKPWAAVVLLAVLTLGPLLLSDDIVGPSRHLLGDLQVRGLPSWIALAAMFVADTLVFAWLVGKTGGTRNSHFTAVLVSLPPLAIFLREPLERLQLYLTLVVCGLLFGVRYERREDVTVGPLGYWFILVACLSLTTFVGYATRPI
jgi:hypothetical protein